MNQTDREIIFSIVSRAFEQNPRAMAMVKKKNPDRSIRLSQLFPTLKREKYIAGLRPDYKDYIYVWVLGSVPDNKNLNGLADIRDHLFGLSEKLQLPILIETTVEKVRKLYRYVGFEEYHHWEDTRAGINVWFLERKVHQPERVT